jgi:hypothetical protein
MNHDDGTQGIRMKLAYRALTIVAACCFTLLGCKESAPPAPTTYGTTTPNDHTTFENFTDTWAGQWNGPEGTFLKIDGRRGVYTLTIQNLDGPSTYEGKSVDHRIRFMRNDREAYIQATDGAGTGMKWLAEKQNCLVIRAGEGFCRD